ncbi:MAG: OmpH family outer membrane protein [Neisseriaceae bacterium]|nr:MAG: OmpH family outer membrane protein [Neisseriaceae bacterium]
MRVKKIAVVAGLLMLGSSQMALAELKVGFVNTERVFREAAPAQRALKALEKEFAPRAQELQALAKQIRETQADLDKNSMTMKETDRRAKERDIEAMNRDFQRRNREFREDQNMRSGQEMASIQERANKVIQQIADAEKYDLILQEAVFVSPRIDITDKVLKSLSDK